MKFETPLIQGTLIRRYNRFLADILLPGQRVVIAHCPNSGSMKGLVDTGNKVWISENLKESRQLKYTLEIIEVEGTLVGVNTQHPNKLVEEALRQGLFPSLMSYAHLHREVKYGQNSRIDFLLCDDAKPDTYIEVKNVTLAENRKALFPDAVTARGTKHLNELMDMVAQHKRGVMIYLIQREDCTSFSIAAQIDPLYAKTFLTAYEKGVEILAYDCIVEDNEIRINKPVPVDLNFQ